MVPGAHVATVPGARRLLMKILKMGIQGSAYLTDDGGIRRGLIKNFTVTGCLENEFEEVEETLLELGQMVQTKEKKLYEFCIGYLRFSQGFWLRVQYYKINGDLVETGFIGNTTQLFLDSGEVVRSVLVFFAHLFEQGLRCQQ